MAVVFLAYDEELERPVAIKLLADNLTGDESFRERFVREARIAAGLAHPNIVQVFDAGDDRGRPHIVMEYVEGDTLAELLSRRGTLPWSEAVDLMLQVCAGLEHAHAKGLVHRDVKPQNLLLRKDGTLKIVDFGIARAAEATRLTQIGTVLGTAAYLAPEQAAGEQVTAAADLYSLGAVLYECLTGRTPYVFESLTDLVVKQQTEGIPAVRDFQPDVPPALEDAVMRCLARGPAYRPGSAAELAHELAAATREPRSVPLPQPSGVRTSEVATVPLRPGADGATVPVRRKAPRSLTVRRSTLWLAAGGIATALAVSVGLALADRGENGQQRRLPSVPEVPSASNPAARAENFGKWLRENSR